MIGGDGESVAMELDVFGAEITECFNTRHGEDCRRVIFSVATFGGCEPSYSRRLEFGVGKLNSPKRVFK